MLHGLGFWVLVFMVCSWPVVCLMVASLRATWRVAAPNEALIVTGARDTRDGDGDGPGFNVISGDGGFVVPGLQTVSSLSLELRAVNVSADCITLDGEPIALEAAVIFKVGDDLASIVNATRRFLSQQDRTAAILQQLFEGHLRIIASRLTGNELRLDSVKVAQTARDVTRVDVEKVGIVIDAFQIVRISARVQTL
jgi:flotillin